MYGDQWRSIEKMFLPNAAIAGTLTEAFAENVRYFWENQEKVLDSMQAVADGWFERRRVGTHEAREAAEKMYRFKSFESVFRNYRDWASGVFERIAADGLSCQQQMMAISATIGSPPLAPSRSEKTAEPARSESKISARSNAA